jgi:hypothetical protein
MTNQHHPITPPPELLSRWEEDWHYAKVKHIELEDHIAHQAASWGADQELEACCDWFQEFYKTESWVKHDLKHFRDARRPKPPSLKEQALGLIDSNSPYLDDAAMSIIRRALESLPS